MIIRKALLNDAAAIMQLCQQSIQQVCNADYSPEQIKVWCDAVANINRWERAIESQYFIVAEIGGALAGFGSIEAGEYIDFLYVHPNYLKQGIANAIVAELISEAKRQQKAYVWANVSQTAKQFFQHLGFVVEKQQANNLQSVVLINFRMTKTFAD